MAVRRLELNDKFAGIQYILLNKTQALDSGGLKAISVQKL